MSTKSIGAGESPAAAPMLPRTGVQFAFANKFLLTAMKTFVSFSIVLTSERFAADCANKRSLISVGSQMRPQVVGTSEFFSAQVALKVGRVFLYSGASMCGRRVRSSWICEIENVFAGIDGRG